MSTPTPGRIVLYRLGEQDCQAINRRRTDALAAISWHREHTTGAQVHTGNPVSPGDEYPAVIVRVFSPDEPGTANLQVLLDGNDTFWAPSRIDAASDLAKSQAEHNPDGHGYYRWPERV